VADDTLERCPLIIKKRTKSSALNLNRFFETRQPAKILEVSIRRTFSPNQTRVETIKNFSALFHSTLSQRKQACPDSQRDMEAGIVPPIVFHSLQKTRRPAGQKKSASSRPNPFFVT
jgi:hypothetical protein